MFNPKRRFSYRWLSVASAGVLLQASCPLDQDFDPTALFAEAASTFFTDSIFFAIDSYLVSIG